MGDSGFSFPFAPWNAPIATETAISLWYHASGRTSVNPERSAALSAPKARFTIAASWARVSRPFPSISPFEPFSRPFWTALRRPAADQSVGKS